MMLRIEANTMCINKMKSSYLVNLIMIGVVCVAARSLIGFVFSRI
jgi:hypothetical protein